MACGILKLCEKSFDWNIFQKTLGRLLLWSENVQQSLTAKQKNLRNNDKLFLDSKNNFENSNLDDENELDLDVQELLEKNKNIYNTSATQSKALAFRF